VGDHLKDSLLTTFVQNHVIASNEVGIYSLRVDASARLNKEVVLEVIKPEISEEQVDLNQDYDEFGVFKDITK